MYTSIDYTSYTVSHTYVSIHAVVYISMTGS